MTQYKERYQKSKRITIDDLARMVAIGFSSVEERMDQGFKEVNERIDQTNERIDRTNEKLDRIEDQYGRRLDNVEGRAITLKSHMENELKKKFAW